MSTGTIEIHGLAVECHIGVPDGERAHPQRLLLDITLHPRVGFESMDDDVSRSADYAAVAVLASTIAARRPRRLVETLAADIARAVIDVFPLRGVEVTIRKFILPQTEYIAVRYRLDS